MCVDQLYVGGLPSLCVELISLVLRLSKFSVVNGRTKSTSTEWKKFDTCCEGHLVVQELVVEELVVS